jgi:hypothetical protein
MSLYHAKSNYKITIYYFKIEMVMFKKIKAFLKKDKKNAENDKFIPDMEDYGVISCEKADFIYNNSKEYLLNTIDNFKKLQTKIILILGFIFSFATFASMKIVSMYEEHTRFIETLNPHYSRILYLSSDSYYFINHLSAFLLYLTILYLLVAAILVIQAFYPKNRYTSGNEPREIIYQKFLDQDISLIKVRESINYQKRINLNSKTNKKTATIIKGSLISMILFPIILIFYLF